MDIYSYLKKDHRKVSGLMEQALKARSPVQREDILAEIEEELLLHAETEQATFYAALENVRTVKENIAEAKDEHAEIKSYLKKLSALSADSEKWIELFGEFKHAVEHHVKEEEGMIFEKARSILSDYEAREIADDMDRLKMKGLRKAA